MQPERARSVEAAEEVVSSTEGIGEKRKKEKQKENKSSSSIIVDCRITKAVASEPQSNLEAYSQCWLSFSSLLNGGRRNDLFDSSDHGSTGSKAT